MVWKGRREKTTTLKQSTLGSRSISMSAKMGKLPRKSCLRSQEFSLDSDWSNGGSSVSSQRSETVRCESSLNSAQATSTISTRISSPPAESLDAQDCKVVRVAEPPATETTNRSTGSNSTSSQKSKNVRFSVVEIRDYAREVADNPSCSSGPPIGIGWRHLDSRVVHVNHYEHSRPYRKGQLELVLTREERETLLAEWGVSTQDIVSSTRALIKAKNQRRQTVRNLNKAERVEEGLENATRKLMRLLSFRKSPKVELEQLQRQAEFAAALSPARFQEVDEPADTKQSLSEGGEVTSNSSRAEITEKEDSVLGDFEVKLGPSVGNRNATHERTVVKDEMDTISCISGFTLGNSTTASALEIERFHRELELELFGDQELPSMVGQTLEVDVEIPEEDKVFHDPSPICGTQEPPSVVSGSINPESTFRGGYGNPNPSYGYPNGYHPHPVNPLQQQSLPIPNFQNTQGYDSYGNYQMQMRGQPANFEFRLGGSFDSATEANSFLGKSPDTHTSFEVTRQTPTPYSLAQASNNYATGSRWTDAIPHKSNQRTDGPLVTHVPLASHLSPNNWMEGSYREIRRPPARSPWDAVIISEDDMDEEQQHFVEQASVMPLFH